MRVEVEDLGFRYGRRDHAGDERSAARPRALEGLSLRAESGELVALLGPSGSGKTTLLEILAGFLQPQQGRVRFAGRTVSSPTTRLAPRKRGVGMVFQDLALWEHLTVAGHLDFVLSAQGVARAERQRRRESTLALVGLAPLRERRPAELSGGEAQRLALARALVGEPRVLLLDEPLGALDRSLREKMLGLLAEVHDERRATTVYVTHDYDEAVFLARRIAILERGRVLQQAGPEDLYRRPANATVARLAGPASLLRGTVARPGEVECALGSHAATFEAPAGTTVTVVLRPEQVELRADPNGRARVRARLFHAGRWKIDAAIGSERLEGFSATPLEAGARVEPRVDEPLWGWATKEEA